MKDSFLVLSGRYQLALLGSRAKKLAKNVENALFDWVWQKQDGIRYLGILPANPPKGFTPGTLDRFFTSHEILPLFPSWRGRSKIMVDWLLKPKKQRRLLELRTKSEHVDLLSVVRELATNKTSTA